MREQHERDTPNDHPELGSSGSRSRSPSSTPTAPAATFVKKVQAEPDPDAARSGPVRWIANGKTIVNNKGKPVLQYEPYFQRAAIASRSRGRRGRLAGHVLRRGRAGSMRTEMPDGTFSRVEFSPWLSRSFDQNDTVLEPGNRWYAERTAPGASAEDRRAARLAALHAGLTDVPGGKPPTGTPAETHFDSLGREVIAIAHNRTPSTDPLQTTRR